jgi:conjugal transfer pilus assembly protein TraW
MAEGHLMIRALLLVWILLPTTLPAMDLGVRGHLFEIEEADLLQIIQERIANTSDTKLREAESKLVKRIQNPRPVEGIRNTIQERTFYFDPTVTVYKDIRDHQGKVIVAKGERINPLEKMAYPGSLLFFDGSDAQQVEWARAQEGGRWTLVKGNPMELEEIEGRPVYFDQFGSLVKKLGITQVPAIMVEEGDRFKISEVLL